MYDPVIEVLEIIEKDGLIEQRDKAHGLLNVIQSFEFIFIVHLMKSVLGMTNILSEALQRKDQDIVNAMNLVNISKKELEAFREDGCDSLFGEVREFCEKKDIIIPKIDELFTRSGRSRRRVQEIIILHHYRVDMFFTMIDSQIIELNNRFDEVNMKLLTCMKCLNPSDSFAAFDKEKLIALAKFYPYEFSKLDVLALHNELDTYIIDLRSDLEFSYLKKISDLSQKLVETKRDDVYPLVYMLLKLALILSVATATVKRAFSAINIVKNRMRNKMGGCLDERLLDYLH